MFTAESKCQEWVCYAKSATRVTKNLTEQYTSDIFNVSALGLHRSKLNYVHINT
jgi:hypothetical protein